MTAPAAPHSACAVIINVAVGLKVIKICDAQNRTTAKRNTCSAPNRCASLAPSMTKPATSIE
jgi:hypothetical protein